MIAHGQFAGGMSGFGMVRTCGGSVEVAELLAWQTAVCLVRALYRSTPHATPSAAPSAVSDGTLAGGGLHRTRLAGRIALGAAPLACATASSACAQPHATRGGGGGGRAACGRLTLGQVRSAQHGMGKSLSRCRACLRNHARTLPTTAAALAAMCALLAEMDLLGSYAASDSEEEEVRMPSASTSIVVDVAPAVNTAGLTVVQDENGSALVLPLAQTSQYIGASASLLDAAATTPPSARWYRGHSNLLPRSGESSGLAVWYSLEYGRVWHRCDPLPKAACCGALQPVQSPCTCGW